MARQLLWVLVVMLVLAALLAQATNSDCEDADYSPNTCTDRRVRRRVVLDDSDDSDDDPAQA